VEKKGIFNMMMRHALMRRISEEEEDTLMRKLSTL
jgi:hypothetical protein